MKYKEPNRKRKVQVKVRFSEQEYMQIKKNMADIGITNMSFFFRQMVLRGHVMIPNDEEIRKTNYELNRIGNNINQIAHRVNSTGEFYATDLKLLQEEMDNICQLQRYMLSVVR